MHITTDTVDAAAEALYIETCPEVSKSVNFQDRALGSRERFRAIARASLISANSVRFGEGVNEAGEAIYWLMDPKNAKCTPFQDRSEGSKDRYRRLARIMIAAAS
jgi:hypothetical protein